VVAQGRSGRVSLTVDAVRYASRGVPGLGVASISLAERIKAGDKLKVYVQRRMPSGCRADPSVPIIMVGPAPASRRSRLPARAHRHPRARPQLLFSATSVPIAISSMRTNSPA